MAESRDNLVLRMLRQLRAIREEHRAILDGHSAVLRKLESGQRDILSPVLQAAG